MPWTESDYPASWKTFDNTTRQKAIDIGNAMLKNGYKEEDAIPIATAQAKDWAADATKAEKKELDEKDLTKHKKNPDNKGATYIENDVHVFYDNKDKVWKVQTEGADQAADTYDTKKEAMDRAKEIAENRSTDVISHKKE